MGIEAVSGRVVFLRAHECESGWGPAHDFLDAEVIVRLAGDPDSAYGFQLRQDPRLPAHEAMYELVSSAFERGWNVDLDVDVTPGHKNHPIVRVAVARP
jgi:hypothetical protein